MWRDIVFWIGISGLVVALLGALLCSVVWCLNWEYRAQKRQEEQERLADEKLPWQDFIDGKLARRVAELLLTVVRKHCHLLGPWAKRERPRATKPTIPLMSINHCGVWLQLFRLESFYICVGNETECRCLGSWEDANFRSTVVGWLAEALMEQGPHPRELVAMLERPILEQNLLLGLLGHTVPLSALEKPQVLDGRQLSFPDGELVIGEVLRLHDTDQTDDDSVSTSA